MSTTAVVAGVGPGLGESLVGKFVSEGCSVGMFSRSEDYLESLEREFGTDHVLGIPTDISDPDAVERGFRRVRESFGPVDVLVNNASASPWKGLLDINKEEFERSLGVGASGFLYCSQEAVGDMVENDGGTVIFTGATTSVRGRGNAIGFSASKFAARGMAESMARELGPEGIHVAHVIVDGQILTPDTRERYDDRDEDSFLDPDEIAESYWHLVEQDRTSWTLELDLRPYVEDF